MHRPDIPPAVCIIGKKNSGKTTLVVALASELSRRGWRVATIKHGHHDFEMDHTGRDSYRHFHEGGAEASIMCGEGKIGLVMRIEGEPDPTRLVEEFYAGRGYDLVLVEGFKMGALPKIEIFRREAHRHPVYDPADAENAARFLAVLTDAPGFDAPFPVILLDPFAEHVRTVADLLERRFPRHDH
jgi:molybdopterin-guanine dinucleotide biosynthesis protein MobB